MKLISDFRDYYDIWFEPSYSNTDLVFERLTKSGPNKQEQFKLIAACGYKVIPYGKPQDFKESDLLVVYLDEDLHCGEGKILTTQVNALEEYSDKLCSLFMDNNSISSRLLWIGSRCFELTYENLDKAEWRSNVGDISIRVEKELFNHPHPVCLSNYPLVAIDFVGEYGVDLNISPGLKYTGLEDIISGREVYKLIKSFIKNDLS